MGFVSRAGEWAWRKLKQFLHSTTTRRVVGYLFFFALLTFILFTNFRTYGLQLRPGQISPRDIKSPVTRVIVDETRTQELKRQAAQKVKNIYQEDTEAFDRASGEIDLFFRQVTGIIKDGGPSKDEKLQQLAGAIQEVVAQKKLKKVNPKALALYLLNVQDEDLEKMRQQSHKILSQVMDKPITEEALPSLYQQAFDLAHSLEFAYEAEEIIAVAVCRAARPNMIFDAEATQKAIDEAVNKVLPVQRTIRQNQIIIRAGDPVTEEHIEILEQLGLQRSGNLWMVLGGTALFVLLTFWLMIEYLRRYHRDILREDRLMLLLGLVILIVVLLAKVVNLLNIGGRADLTALNGYLIPASVGSMLVAVLIDSRLAYIVAMLLAFYVGMMASGNQLGFALTAFAGGTAGVFGISRLSQTSDLARSGLYVALANVSAILAVAVSSGNPELSVLLFGSLMGVLNGFLSAVLLIGFLPYLESAFSITSMIKLLELSNPNQPLLRRLLVEAPGTYHHSLMVGNLAEAAAEAIGAQPLLVRVGSYYHDIGKLKRPYFFIENQIGFENPHEKIAPSLSSLIITSHIKDGVEMAKEARLPKVIVDFIEQHHGTSLVKYFYSRALEEDGVQRVNEEAFRYEGPKPQSKEAALIMLADAVEAGVRSLTDATPGKIEGMVRRIIKDKLNDGQLEECNLTFRDLAIIAESFSKVLNGIYHARIEYPDNLAEQMAAKGVQRGNNSNKQAGEG